MVRCPKCDADVTETYEPDDWSVGIRAGYYCFSCDLGVAEWEVPREPLPDDVPVLAAREKSDEGLGTPLSELSDRPGHPGFAEFCRIAKSWGRD